MIPWWYALVTFALGFGVMWAISSWALKILAGEKWPHSNHDPSQRPTSYGTE
jgi:hypothetical protein